MSNSAGFLQSIGNRLPDENAEALAETEHSLPDGIGLETRGLRRSGMVAFGFRIEKGTQRLEEGRPAAGLVFRFKRTHRGIETSHGPRTVIGGSG